MKKTVVLGLAVLLLAQDIAVSQDVQPVVRSMSFEELESCAKTAFSLKQDLAKIRAIERAIEKNGKAIQAESALVDALRAKVNLRDRQAVAAFNARLNRSNAAVANYRSETQARDAVAAKYRKQEASSNILCAGRPYDTDDLAKVQEPWRSAMSERSKPVTIPTVGSLLTTTTPDVQTSAAGIAKNAAARNALDVEAMRKLADSGNADAQYTLAQRYEFGRGLDRNPEKAFKYYKMAADQGNAASAFAVSNFLFDGRDVPENATLALEYLRKSAAAGDHMAEHNLALWYESKSRDRDRQERAFQSMSKAATSGNAESQMILGQYYSDGFGTKRDPAKGFEWLGKAANQGYRAAQLEVGAALQAGKGVTRSPVEALKWYLLAAGMTKQDAARGCTRLVLESSVSRQRAEQAAKALQKDLSAFEADKAAADAEGWVAAYRAKALVGC